MYQGSYGFGSVSCSSGNLGTMNPINATHFRVGYGYTSVSELDGVDAIISYSTRQGINGGTIYDFLLPAALGTDLTF